MNLIIFFPFKIFSRCENLKETLTNENLFYRVEIKTVTILYHSTEIIFSSKIILQITSSHLPIELYLMDFWGLLRISKRSFPFPNKINKTGSDKSTCKSSLREIKDNGPRYPARKIKARLFPHLFLARAYCYFYSRFIIIFPLIDKSGHSISFILNSFVSSCSKSGN